MMLLNANSNLTDPLPKPATFFSATLGKPLLRALCPQNKAIQRLPLNNVAPSSENRAKWLCFSANTFIAIP